MPYPAPTDSETVLGILRFSHKYGVDYLRRRALVHLSSRYFTTLSDRDDSYDPSASSWKRPSWPVDSLAVHVEAIQLARQVDALWILPYAFYDAATVSDSEELRNVLGSSIPDGWSASLSAEDQASFLKGYLTQMHSSSAEILRFLHHPLIIEDCTTAQKCTSERLAAFSHMDDLVGRSMDPLDVWIADDWETMEICVTCLASLQKTHREARAAFWDKLPEIYGLPGWEELKELKTAAIGDDLFT